MHRAGIAMISIGLSSAAAQEKDEEAIALSVQAERLQGALVFCHGLTNPGNAALGCFIDDQGSAVFHIQTFTGLKQRRFALKDGTLLKEPRLLHIEPVYGLAFAKFEEMPKHWIEPRREPVPLKNCKVGILTILDSPRVLCGPIWGRGHTWNTSFLRPAFSEVAYIATGMPVGKPGIAGGSPLIDANGHLCGIYMGSRNLETMQELMVAPTDVWYEAIETARKATKSIPFPEIGERSPLDPALGHPDYTEALRAWTTGNSAKAIEHVNTALRNHPESRLLKSLRFDIAESTSPDELKVLASDFKPGADANPCEKVRYLMYMGKALKANGDCDGAIARYREAAELAPKDYSPPYYELGLCFKEKANLDEAIRNAKQALKGSPVNLPLLESINLMLIRVGREVEAREVEEEIWKLEKLLRTVLR